MTISEIAIYVEGGGDRQQQRAELRNGLDRLLAAAKNAARAKHCGWKVVPCGGRNQTFDKFKAAMRQVGSVVVLLVDSEGPTAALNSSPEERAAHLTDRDGWNLSEHAAERIHLMVQCMETWIIADAAALKEFYGTGFVAKHIPKARNLESVDKNSVIDALDNATRGSKRGEYAKLRHGAALVGVIDANKVALRCPHFRILIDWLTQVIDS